MVCMTRNLVQTPVHLCCYHEVNAPFNLSAVLIRERKASTVGLNWLVLESVFRSYCRNQAIEILEHRLGPWIIFSSCPPLFFNTNNSYNPSRWAFYLRKKSSGTWMTEENRGQTPQLVRDIWTRSHQVQRCDHFLQILIALNPSKASLYYDHYKYTMFSSGFSERLCSMPCGIFSLSNPLHL